MRGNTQDFRMCLRLISLFSVFGILATSASADFCQRGDNGDVRIVLQDADNAVSIPLSIDEGYFDPRFVPSDGAVRRAQKLRLRADSFKPWPRDVRAHQSEGPYLSLLIAKAVDLETVAERLAIPNLGYRFTDSINWSDVDAPYGLLRFTAPPPENRLTGQLFRDLDIYHHRDQAGAITDVIRCQRPNDRPYRNCSHLIETGEMDLRLTYAVDFLPDWRRLSRGARAVYSCMRVN